jgi:Cu(I)/Ag(I) efflux system protein CusF
MKFAKSALLAMAIVASLAHAGALAQAATEMTQGEIRKVDKAASKITIRHSEIKSLDMPPMTMVFTVKHPALLDQVKTGDKVKFNAVVEDGKIVVTEIEAAQ